MISHCDCQPNKMCRMNGIKLKQHQSSDPINNGSEMSMANSISMIWYKENSVLQSLRMFGLALNLLKWQCSNNVVWLVKMTHFHHFFRQLMASLQLANTITMTMRQVLPSLPYSLTARLESGSIPREKSTQPIKWWIIYLIITGKNAYWPIRVRQKI